MVKKIIVLVDIPESEYKSNKANIDLYVSDLLLHIRRDIALFEEDLEEIGIEKVSVDIDEP